MIITLKDGSKKEYSGPMSVYDIAGNCRQTRNSLSKKDHKKKP